MTINKIVKVVGVLLIVAGIVIDLYALSFSTLNELALQLNDDAESVVATLKNAGQSARSGAASIVSASSALESSSKVIGDMGLIFNKIGSDMNIEFFGVRPFGGVSDFFVQEKNKLDEFSVKLDDLNVNLVTNAKDLNSLASNLDKTAEKFKATGDTLVSFVKQVESLFKWTGFAVGTILILLGLLFFLRK